VAEQEIKTRRNDQGVLVVENPQIPGEWRKVPQADEHLFPKPEAQESQGEGVGAHWQRGLLSGVTLGIDPAEEALVSKYGQLGGVAAQHEPQTAWESAARTSGELVGSIPPIAGLTAGFVGGGWVPASLGGAAALARSSPRLIQTLRQMIVNPYTRSKGAALSSMGSEAVAGFGAGLGRHEARGTGFEPVGETLGTLLGAGVGTSLPVRATGKLVRTGALSTTRGGRERLRREAEQKLREGGGAIEKTWREHPLSPGKSGLDPSGRFAGGTLTGQRVTESIRGRLANPSLAREQLRKKAISPYTTLAQRVGDPNLLANAEFIIKSEGPEALTAYQQRINKAIADLGRRAFEGPPGTTQTQTSLPDTVFQLRDVLGQHAVRLGRDTPRTNIAVRAADDLQRAYDGAKVKEGNLWKSVTGANPDIEIPTTEISRKWKAIIKKTTQAEQEDIPQNVRPLLNFLDEHPQVPANEIQGIYSKLREIARLDRGSNQSRLANDFASAADEALEPFGIYQEARAFTRTMHDAFDRNSHIWKLFESAGRSGEQDIRRNPTAIMEALGLFRTTSTSANSLRDLLDASSFAGPTRQRNNAEMVGAVDDFLRKQFLSASRDPQTGRELVNVRGARNFIAKHGDLWDGERFPELIPIGNELSQVARQVERVDRLSKLRKEMGNVLSSDRPLMRFRSALQLGPEGAAQLSRVKDRDLVQSALLDEVSRIPSGKKGAGGFLPDAGQKLSEYLKSPKTREVFSAVYTEPELQRLSVIADEWRRVEMSLKTAEQTGALIPGEAILEDTLLGRMVGWIRTAGRLGAAQAPYRLGFGGGGMGGGIQTASIAASRADKALKSQMDAAVWDTLERAYKDETGKILDDILQNVDTMDASSLQRLLRMGGAVLGKLVLSPVKRVATSAAVPLSKMQVPTDEERQSAVDWFEQNPVSAFDPQIAPVPQQPQGPRIGPPRR
jgi:hypothetical protein